jgi:hypothetical protein
VNDARRRFTAPRKKGLPGGPFPSTRPALAPPPTGPLILRRDGAGFTEHDVSTLNKRIKKVTERRIGGRTPVPGLDAKGTLSSGGAETAPKASAPGVTDRNKTRATRTGQGKTR